MGMTHRPRTRAECPTGPCRWVGCRYHLWTDQRRDRRGVVTDLPRSATWGDVAHTCVLHEADHGGMTLEVVGSIVRLTRERVRQIEALAMKRLSEQHTYLLRELLDGANAMDDPDSGDMYAPGELS